MKKTSSIFYRLLIVPALIGVIPAILISTRLLLLNRSLLQASQETWSIPVQEIQRISSTLTSEAISYSIYILMTVLIFGTFASATIIRPLRRLQVFLSAIQKTRSSENKLAFSDQEKTALDLEIADRANSASGKQNELKLIKIDGKWKVHVTKEDVAAKDMLGGADEEEDGFWSDEDSVEFEVGEPLPE